MGVKEMRAVAGMIYRVLTSLDDEGTGREVLEEVTALTRCFPLYAERLKEDGGGA